MPEGLMLNTPRRIPLERRYKIDKNWPQQEDRAAAIKTNLCGSIEQDLGLIAQSSAFSILAHPSIERTRIASKEAAEEGPFDARLIEVTLRNAQLSYLIDEIILTFIEGRPMPLNELQERIKQITDREEIRLTLEEKYQEMLNVYEGDKKIQDLPEHLDDVFERHTDLPYHQDEDFRQCIATLKWLRLGIESGEITYDGECWPLKKRVTLLKLPFADIVFMISANAFSHYGTAEDLAERRAKKQEGKYEKTKQELRLEKLNRVFVPDISEADAALAKLPHRSLIRLGNLYNDLDETLLSIRHELKHVVDQQLLSDRPLFYTDSDPADSFRTALEIETTLLVSECSALSLSGDFSYTAFSRYYYAALTTLKKADGDQPSNKEAIDAFKRDWQAVLTFLKKEEEYLQKLTREEAVFLYHCIANSKTSKEVLKHLKHGLDYISSKAS